MGLTRNGKAFPQYKDDPTRADDIPFDPFLDSTSSLSTSPLKIVTRAPLGTSAPSTFNFPRSPFHDDEDEETPLLNSGTTFGSPPYKLAHRSRSSIVSFDLRSINERVSHWTNTIARWTSSSRAVDGIPNEIQYSVFKPPPGITPLEKIPNGGFVQYGPVTKEDFEEIVQDAIDAIEFGVEPKRIAAGSSGSYFVRNTSGDIVGVFKPKDEEPYGPLSPKWTKWLHRNLFPCFFGRSCLIPNLGYICESAASLLDKQLQSYIVPYTDIVTLSSDAFYYSYWEKRSARRHNRPLREKAGSFQLFLNGYMEADKFLAKHPLPGSIWGIPRLYAAEREFEWTPDVILQFREELEKLVILDYIMRNTDRGADNWMIKLEWAVSELDGSKRPVLKVGAIDSGLAWPWKHPDEWRSYPFGWLFLPASIIGQPFTEKTRQHYLPILTSTAWWEECTVLFREIFARDEDFKERMWKKQWAVMKGQAFNVVETLKNPTQGPLELARRTRVMVWDEVMEVPVHVPVSVMTNAIETPISPWKRQGSAQPPNLDAIREDRDNEERAAATETPENTGLTFAEGTMATKKVIIERLQAVNSKPPVFTWC